MIEVKILGYHSAQRYATKQRLVAAKKVLLTEIPDLELVITELKDWVHIEEYTPVLSAPSLVVNDKLVCVGRVPSSNEILGWIRGAVG
jgi:Thioredoxin domain